MYFRWLGFFPKIVIEIVIIETVTKKMIHTFWSVASLKNISKVVLDINDHYQIVPAKYFCPNTFSLSAICDSLKLKVLKVVKSKKWTPLLLYQFFITRNFIAQPKKIP